MSSVAHQYNLIGETLKQGIGGLMEGQARGKALEMQALKMGIESQERQNVHLSRMKQFQMEQDKFDENKRRYVEQRNDPKFLLEQDRSRETRRAMNRDATDFSLGIDQEWEKEWFDEKIMPLLSKHLGITKNERGQFVDKDGRVIKHGEIKANADIAGLMLANLDVNHSLNKQLQVEEGRLAAMGEEGYFDGGLADDSEQQGKIIQDQKQIIKSIQDQMVDMEKKPIKYLNTKLDLLADIMAGSPDPSIHMVRFNELAARRNALLEERKASHSNAFKNLYQQKIYNENGDVIFSKYLHKSQSPNDDKELMMIRTVRDRLGKRTYFDEPASAKRTTKAVSALTGSMAGSLAIMKAYQKGGIEGAAKVIHDMNVASGAGKDMMHDEVMDGLKGL
ncbi:MAG: hypothetical protein ACXABY_35270, partial [Candidatus Thorarchaeota archaeon]